MQKSVLPFTKGLTPIQLKRLFEWLEWRRQMATSQKEKFDDGRTTYGDSPRIASDVEFGREEAFEEVYSFLNKLANN